MSLLGARLSLTGASVAEALDVTPRVEYRWAGR
jgi:hypothetical protein